MKRAYYYLEEKYLKESADYIDKHLDNVVIIDDDSRARILNIALNEIKLENDNSIDCVITSPPYFNTGKKYQRGKGCHYSSDFAEPLYNIMDIMELIKPKLKDNATIWWNVGDSYSSGKRTSTTNQSLRGNKNYGVTRTPVQNGIKEKEIRPDIPAEYLSIMIMGSFRLLVRKWRAAGYKYDLVKEGENMWRNLKKVIEG